MKVTRPPTRARRGRRVGVLAAGASMLAISLIPTASASVSPDQDEATISVLSSRPDFVSGGDALIQVEFAGTDPLPHVNVVAGGTDQSSALAADAEARTLTGVVEGLPLGESEIAVQDAAGTTIADLEVINHPKEGPLLGGPHEEPYVCQTDAATIPVIGGTLGEPLDANCTVEDRVDYFYQDTSSTFRAWPQGATMYPGDVRYTTNIDGEQVPFIVRMETGTVNRAIYRTTVMHDPLTEEEPSPTMRPQSWNGAGIFMFGGGCNSGWYRQGTNTGDVTNTFMLQNGFALMSSSLNVFGNNCNDLLAAESAAMVKETFVENYGAPDHVIGIGGSGGAYQSLQIADNYPGVLDGIIISDTFPDVLSGTVNYITDSKLLHTYFQNTDTEWTEDERDSVTGFLNYDTVAQVASDQRTNPRNGCDHIPASDRYDPDTNPGGVRCDVFSHTVNVYGTDPETGLPRRPLDNVGVQYGLGALNDGGITVEQFLDLNDSIGGLDGDSNLVAERTEGDTEAIRAAYQTGRVLNGGAGLADIPIVDRRTYRDEREGGDIHASYHSHSLRQRLIEANGTADNLVSLIRDSSHPAFSREVILGMDQWLRDIAADESGGAPLERIVANRPAHLVDGCYLRDGSGTFVEQPLDRDPESICEQQYPSGSFPREVAGEDIASNIVKCEVDRPAREDYDVAFTDEQWERLLQTFPDGVCDYTQPGVEQQGLAGTWLRFNDIPEPDPTDEPTDEPTDDPTDDPTDEPTSGPAPSDGSSALGDDAGEHGALPSTGVTGALLGIAAVLGLTGAAMAAAHRRGARVE